MRTETDKKKDRAKECSKKPRETNLRIGRQKTLSKASVQGSNTERKKDIMSLYFATVF